MLKLLRPLGLVVILALVGPALHAQDKPKKLPKEDSEEVLEKHESEYRNSVSRSKEKGAKEDVRGRTEWFMFQRRYPYDMVPAGLRSAAIRQTKAMEDRMADLRRKGDKGAMILSASRWEPIGPVNIAGRVPAVAQHPTTEGTIYVGAASGGVWKTTDDGKSWRTTFDKQSSLTVGALAIDPVDPRIIYAGTGECYGHTEEYFGDGIFKSADDGATWQNIGLRNVGGFAKIYVHRQKHETVYAVATKENGGFYRSEDGGKSWTRTFQSGVYDISVNPKNCDELVICTGSSIHYSSDGGKSFVNRTAGVGVSGSIRISIAMAPSDPNRLYALLARSAGPNVPNIAELYSSRDGGKTWRFHQAFGNAFFRSQGFYNNCIAVHPTDPNIVLIGGIDIYKSVDGGTVFYNITQSYERWMDAGIVHPDQHAVEFDPKNPNRVLIGNDGGLYVSENTAETFTKMSLDLPITQFYKIDVDQNDLRRVYGGTQDNGTCGSTGHELSAMSWTMISGGDGFYVVADPYNPNIVYTEIYFGKPTYKIDINNYQNPQVIDDNVPELGDWSTPLVMGLIDGKLYSGRRNLWRTSNSGVSWQQLRPGTRNLISAVALSNSIDDPDNMVVGSNGEVRFSIDDGKTWRAASGIPNRVVSDLKFDPALPHRVYATVSGSGTGHVYLSENDGANFVNISSNLPDAPVNCIVIDPADNSHLFVGTDAGCFVSLDGGKLWMPFNEGLPLAPVADLKIHEGTRTLIAGTHGRSMFKISIASVEAQPVLFAPVGGASFQSPGPVAARWIGMQGPVRVSISYNGGADFTVAAENVTGDSILIDVPLIKTTMAHVKVEEMTGSNRTLVSDAFTLLPRSNGTEQNRRGFVAEAIEYRKGHLWATVRGTDSIYKLRLPNLTGSRIGIVRTEIPGRVDDLAYDEAGDRFYVLVIGEEDAEPQLFRMDTNGVGMGEVPLPSDIEGASGVAVTAEGIAISTTGTTEEIVILRDDGSVIRRSGAVQGGAAGDRRSLSWNGTGYVQGVVVHDPGAWYESQLELVRLTDSARVNQKIPVILPNVERLEFFGLAVDRSNPEQISYWATDTSGAFFKFGQLFSGVERPEVANARRASEVTLGEIAPNPFRNEAAIVVAAKNRREITLDLYRENGERAMRIFEGIVEAGETKLHLDAGALPSGVYYLVLSGEGERDLRPVVIMR